ncbi:MAG: hypothetical protein KAI47_16700, partial [Deltaproteobacteria bacterium]|nr:hypothetical protein [Deltaproteobacteria bacterium]
MSKLGVSVGIAALGVLLICGNSRADTPPGGGICNKTSAHVFGSARPPDPSGGYVDCDPVVSGEGSWTPGSVCTGGLYHDDDDDDDDDDYYYLLLQRMAD